jgi:hypothetical protein
VKIFSLKEERARRAALARVQARLARAGRPLDRSELLALEPYCRGDRPIEALLRDALHATSVQSERATHADRRSRRLHT